MGFADDEVKPFDKGARDALIAAIDTLEVATRKPDHMRAPMPGMPRAWREFGLNYVMPLSL